MPRPSNRPITIAYTDTESNPKLKSPGIFNSCSLT